MKIDVRATAPAARTIVALIYVTLVALSGLPLSAAQDKVREATVVKVGEAKITLTFKDSDQKHTHDVAKDAEITLNDKKAKLEEVKEGYRVEVVMDRKRVVHKLSAYESAARAYVLTVEGMN